MKYIVEKIQENTRTFYGPFLIYKYAKREIDILMESDDGSVIYEIHQLVPQAQLYKPI